MARYAYARFAAGGSLEWPHGTAEPRLARRLWLISELGLFYIGAPLAMSWAIFAWHIPLFLVLQPVLIGFIAYLLWDDTFRILKEMSKGFSRGTLVSILAFFVVLGGAITAADVSDLSASVFLAFRYTGRSFG